MTSPGLDGTGVPAGPAAAIVDAVRLLFDAGVMSHAGHGNLSVRLDGGRFALTTRGTVRDLTADQLAPVAPDGGHDTGALGPENAEIVAMHAVVYGPPRRRRRRHPHPFAGRHRVHAGQPATAVPDRAAAAVRPGRAAAGGAVGPRGSEVSVRGIARVLDEAPTTNAVLLANHSLLVFGANPVAAARLVVAIEETAEAEIGAAALGGAVDLPAGALEAVRAAMARTESGPGG